MGVKIVYSHMQYNDPGFIFLSVYVVIICSFSDIQSFVPVFYPLNLNLAFHCVTSEVMNRKELCHMICLSGTPQHNIDCTCCCSAI